MVLTVSLMALCCACLPAQATSTSPPNVVVIMTDDQGFGDFSYHGNPVLKTPGLDRLAAGSIRLTDFHVAPVCTPTRGQLLTGLDALRNGATNPTGRRILLKRDLWTMGDVFRANGYRTALYGKWHLGGNFRDFRPHERGFEDAVYFLRGGVQSHPNPWNSDLFDDYLYHNGELKQYPGYATDVWFDLATAFIQRCQKQNAPFFLYLPLNAPHGPLLVPDRYREAYRHLDKETATFFGMIATVDERLDQFVRMLEAEGLRQNTLLVFLTDNGTANGEKIHNAGRRGKKGSLYEGGHRVPCWISWPSGRLRPPGNVEALTQCQDLLPTLIDFCGLRMPAVRKFDGLSLAPLLRGKPQPELQDRILVVQYAETKGNGAVLQGRWRLVQNELYDLSNDPAQQKNVAAQYPDRVRRLQTHYEQWWTGVEPALALEPYRLGVGPEETMLTAYDWWYGRRVYNWPHLRRGDTSNGKYLVLVDQAGKYRISLRRWPRESGAGIGIGVPRHVPPDAYMAFEQTLAPFPPGQALDIVQARVRFGDQEKATPVRPDDQEVAFTFDLPQGRTELQTWFRTRIGQELGAYYVYVRRLPETSPGPQESGAGSSTRIGTGKVAAGDPLATKRQAYEHYALTHAGDPQRGRELYRNDQLAKCAVCHKVSGQGGDAGPDLSQIGGKFDRPHLIESLLEPSRQIVEGFRTSVIVTVDGRVENGIVKPGPGVAITLVDGNGKQQVIATANISERKESPVSLMPEGLAEALTPEQFTDLIAYLESLWPGGKPTPGAAITGPIKLPDGFEIRTVATGLTGCTALETTADGRVFVCEQTGALRIIKKGTLLAKPFVQLEVDSTWERGLIGVTVAPDFPRTPHVYVCYVAREPYPHHRVSRFTADGDVAVPGSEILLLTGDDQRTLGGKVPAGHQGGAVHFGRDGKLYVAIGEHTAETPAQDLGSFQGKLLRLNADGTIPDDNPFLQQTRGKYRAIWALGLRNPFTFAIHPATGEMLINDVGGKEEEINRGVAGANYGWPVVEHGPTTDTRFRGPIHYYPQASIAGGDFVKASSPWPKEYHGRYFFADYVHGWIKSLDPQHPEDVGTFATGLRRPVDLRFAPDGSLYVLLRNAWVIDGKFQPNTGTLLQIRCRGPMNRIASLSAGGGGGGGNGPSGPLTFTENAVDESAGGLPAFKIETPSATYFLEKSGAGLSSLIDKDGHDWLGFHPKPGSGAAGEYRGFPNAVHQQAGNYFHPRNQATDPATTKVAYAGKERVTITADSSNGLWAGRYDFFPSHCTFTMTLMPADKKYWVLYEGTPGGQYDDDDWWMTSASKERRPLTVNHEGDIPAPEWIAFGDKRLERALLLLHHEDDNHPDYFYQMNRQMTVFGFGRQKLTKYLDQVPQRFSIMLRETTRHDRLEEQAKALLKLGR